MLAYILLVAATANTATTAAPATAPAAAEPAKKERMICKSDKFVGSHVTRRICKTESEWEFARRNAQDALDDRGRGGNYRAPGTDGN